jgi:SAM-dependent methyltransferase
MIKLGKADEKKVIELRCPECRNALNLINGIVKCRYCEVLFQNNLPPGSYNLIRKNSEISFKNGLSNQFFGAKRGAYLYAKWILLKHKIQKLLSVEDVKIGLEKEIAGKTVIDVGCGPNLDNESTEYPHKTPSFYVGVDYSEIFVASAHIINGDNTHKFVRASASALPFSDNSFQVALALFTIHHIVETPYRALDELIRVSSEKIIIFDHVKATNCIKRFIQSTYWKIFDGGEKYLTYKEWTEWILQNGLILEQEARSGIFFKHVIKFVLKKA